MDERVQQEQKRRSTPSPCIYSASSLNTMPSRSLSMIMVFGKKRKRNSWLWALYMARDRNRNWIGYLFPLISLHVRTSSPYKKPKHYCKLFYRAALPILAYIAWLISTPRLICSFRGSNTRATKLQSCICVSCESLPDIHMRVLNREYIYSVALCIACKI